MTVLVNESRDHGRRQLIRRWRIASFALSLLALTGYPPGLNAAQATAPTKAYVDAGLMAFAAGEFAEALQNWRTAAESGNSTAALYLGVMYDAGQGVTQSYPAALAWYRRAGDAGSPAGLFNVGVMYDAGRGVPADRAQAAQWYIRAADLGFPRAEYNLGVLYQEGDGVPRNPAKAIQFFRTAYRHGLTAARAHLEALGQHSASTASPVPIEAAMVDFQRAQQMLLARGPTEAGQAAELFRSAAERHNPLAEYDYGYCLETGLGVAQDKVAAYTWYRRAASETKDPHLHDIALSGAGALEIQFSKLQMEGARRALASMP